MIDTSKIRIKEHFGLVTNNTSTKEIRFLISPPKNRISPQMQDIILLDHPIQGSNSQIIAQIKEIASYEEVAGGSSLNERLGKMLASAEIIGCTNQENEDKPLLKLLVPPNPGSRIYMPYSSFIEDAFARNRNGKVFEQPLHLGNLEAFALTPEGTSQKISIFMDGMDVSGMHTLVSGVTGAGKTNLTKVIIEELSQKANVPIVVVDPNGEYLNVAATNYTASTVTSQTKEAPKIKTNQITILNGQTLSLAEKGKFYTNQLTLLAKARLEKTIPGFLLIIEDPENIGAEALKEIVTAKLGITAVLVASHPTGLDAAVLAQMGNQILGKTVNPTDTAYLKAMLNCTEQELTGLFRGEFFVYGLNMARPAKVQVKLAQA
jgi:DNA helicase HerA-like ATPase